MLQLASEVIHQPSGVAMVLKLLRYIGRAATRIDRSEMAQKLLTYLPKEGGVLMQTLAQEWIEEGIERGIERGIEKGVIAQRQILLNFLRYRFSLADQQLENYASLLNKIGNLDRMTQLINQTLTTQTLAEFEQRLHTFLPKEDSAQ